MGDLHAAKRWASLLCVDSAHFFVFQVLARMEMIVADLKSTELFLSFSNRVFYRSIAAVPFSKSLWVLGLRMLRSVMVREEMDDILKIVTLNFGKSILLSFYLCHKLFMCVFR